jgi:subtilisin-like proprotein convertase family protein
VEPTRYRSLTTTLKDDAITYSSLFVTNSERIVDLEVGLRVAHPRVSDLAFTLISPSGTRVVLAENRGGTTTNGMGFDTISTNITRFRLPVAQRLQPTSSTQARLPETVTVNWDFYTVPDELRAYYEGVRIYDSGMIAGKGSHDINFGPGASTLVTLVMNEGGNTDTNTAWDYVVTSSRADYVYLTLTENTNATITPIKYATLPLTNANYIGKDPDLKDQIFYLPEEPLNKLVGERAVGEWRLEVADTRAGATNPVPKLSSWELSFKFEDVVPRPVPLQHEVPSTNTVAPGQIKVFTVDVPDWAKFATNSLLFASAPVNLLFNQLQPPTNGSTALLTASTGGQRTLSAAGGNPRLIPGARYYLGVQNTGTTPVDFAIQVAFDVTPLTNNVPLTSTMPPGSLPRYFSYDVSAQAAGVSFRLFDMNGDLDLYVARDLPFPTPSYYWYASGNFGTNDEETLIFTNSNPFPLSPPGRWYLGVFNNTPASVRLHYHGERDHRFHQFHCYHEHHLHGNGVVSHLDLPAEPGLLRAGQDQYIGSRLVHHFTDDHRD